MFNKIKSVLAAAFDTPYQDVDAQQFEALRQEGAQIVDVRTAGEIASGNVPKSLHMDIMGAGFRQKAQTLDMSRPIAVYCRSGNRSKSACSVLARLGATELYNLRGGFSNWENSQG